MAYRVLITRSQASAQPLLRALEKLNTLEKVNIQASLLPLLEIKPLAEQPEWHEIRSNLEQYDTLIAISPNAANVGMDYLSHYWTQWPDSLQAWAVGRSTALTLKSWGLIAQYPRTAQHSEGLLASLEPIKFTIKQCLILKGLGGRETLEQWLKKHHIRTHAMNLYERTHTQHSKAHIRAILNPAPDLVSITSSESLLAFIKLKNHLDTDIFQTKLLVPSNRLFQIATELGFSALYQARGVDTQAQIEAIQAIMRPMGTNHD